MKITITTLVILVSLLLVGLRMRGFFSAHINYASGEISNSLYDLKTKTLAGEPVDLGMYRGQVALVVNTASKCGLTGQYAGLEALYKELSNKGFVVLGFPANDFLKQEPGTAEEIAQFCTENYGVSFPMFAKTKVKGEQCSEIYRLLAAELGEPSWNFTKYLVAKDGHVVARFDPQIKPDHPQLRTAVERELAVE